MNHRWTNELEEFLKKNAYDLTDEELSRKLSLLGKKKFTIDAVRKKRIRDLGIKKDGGRPKGITRKKEGGE